MSTDSTELNELHWMLDMVQTIDVGLIVLDAEYRVCLWNGFMENHSGLMPSQVKDQVLFDLFPELPKRWFIRKTQTVFGLKNRVFTTWEQRPYLFKFQNYRPITGIEPLMYQDITITPLMSTNGKVKHACLMIYDVTDTATNRKQLKEVNGRLEELSRTDGLTKLNNRRYWEEQLEQEFLRSQRSKSNSCLVMFDIDHFKQVNDNYGHHIGDIVIEKVSAILRDTLRETDTAGRYGGEEFAVILPDTDLQNAMNFSERLRKRIEACEVATPQGALRFTVSLGVAQLNNGEEHYQEWLVNSDTALYQSKESGRNCSSSFQIH